MIIGMINIQYQIFRPKVDIINDRARRDDSNGGLVAYLIQRQFHRHQIDY